MPKKTESLNIIKIIRTQESTTGHFNKLLTYLTYQTGTNAL